MTPNFIIIGAMKCGTTTLADQLAAQSGVFMTHPKEPFYFSDDEVYERGPEWYASLYGDAQPGDLQGEASTHYTMLSDYPETVSRMRGKLNKPKFVYVVRNPVERAISHFMHERIERRVGVDFNRVVAQDPKFIDYQRYADQLEPFVAEWGADSIYVTSLEQIKDDPQGELEKIGAHIGMTSNPVWKEMKAANVSANRSRKLPMHKLLVSSRASIALRKYLMPAWLDRRIRSARAQNVRPVATAETRKAIYAVHHAQSAKLRDMGIAGAFDAMNAVSKAGIDHGCS